MNVKQVKDDSYVETTKDRVVARTSGHPHQMGHLQTSGLFSV